MEILGDQHRRKYDEIWQTNSITIPEGKETESGLKVGNWQFLKELENFMGITNTNHTEIADKPKQ